MPWFTRSTKPDKTINSSSREDRSKCWEARDTYFACLDAAEVVVAGTEGSKCTAERKTYEQNCAKSWVSLYYLSSHHVLKHSVDRLFQPAPRIGREAKAFAGPGSDPSSSSKKIITGLAVRIFPGRPFPSNSDRAAIPTMKDPCRVQYTSSYSRYYCIIHYPAINLLLTSLFTISLAYRPLRPHL